MLNAAKCSGSSQDKLSYKVYENCAEIHKDEIELLKPQLIISQGKDAYPFFLKPKYLADSEFEIFWCDLGNEIKYSKDILRQVIDEYVQIVTLNKGEKAILIKSPHPSSRNGLWQQFRDKDFPIINL